MSSPASPYYDLNFLTFGLLSVVGSVYAILSYVWAYTVGPRPQVASVIVKASNNNSNKKKKLALVTGSNTGIGYETARSLVVDHNIDVILVCRNRAKAEQAAQKINQQQTTTGNTAKASFLHPCDFCSFESVRDFAKEMETECRGGRNIDILINNAGVSNSQGRRTDDDLELIFQSNFLGHFLLTCLLLERDLLVKNDARIINLSSVFHHFAGRHAALDDPKFWKDLARNDTRVNYGWVPTPLRAMTVDFYAAYPTSKLASILFSVELNRRYGSSKNIRSYAVDPGAVHSEIYRDTPRIFHLVYKACFLRCDQGCQPSVAAAVGDLQDDALFMHPYWMPLPSSQVPHPVVEFTAPFVGYRVQKPRLPDDGGLAAAKALWTASEELTKCTFPK